MNLGILKAERLRQDDIKSKEVNKNNSKVIKDFAQIKTIIDINKKEPITPNTTK